MNNKKSSLFKQFYPEDLIVLGISPLILFGLVYFTSLSKSPDYSAIITPAASLLVLTLFMIYQRSTPNSTVRFLRSYLHIPFYGIIFSAFMVYIHKLNPTDYDTLLLKADLSVFGFDITRVLEPIVSRPLTELLTLSYFSYYVLPTLTFVLLYFSRDPASFMKARNYLLALIIGWYGALIFYLALPAAGPDIAFPEHYTVPLTGLSPLTNMYLENLAKYLKESFVRNTFPSMHFGIILITNYFAYLYKRKYFLFCALPLGTLLTIATVYLRQHYLIDLVGSLPVAAMSIYLANRIIRKTT